MNRPRPRHERVPDTQNVHAQDLSETVSALVEEAAARGPNNIPSREYRIKRTMTPKDLQALATLPFEVLLTEHDAGATLQTGSQNNMGPGPDMRLHTQARYTLHNHPAEAIAIPSSYDSGDLKVARYSSAEVNFVVGTDGITIHTPPPENTYQSGYDRDKSFSALLRRWRGVDHLLKYDLKHGFVDAWVPWSEIEDIQRICDYINGTSTWKAQ